MRELTEQEMSQVTGGSIVTRMAGEGSAFGSITGALYWNTMRGAARGGLAGGLLGGSFGAGYAIGGWIYEKMS